MPKAQLLFLKAPDFGFWNDRELLTYNKRDRQLTQESYNGKPTKRFERWWA